MEVHSSAYHKYFEGYAEKQECTSGGKLRIHRVYVGKYYKMDVSDFKRAALRALYGTLYLCACAIYGCCGTTALPCDQTWYMKVLYCGAFLATAAMVFPLWSCLTAPREMEIRMLRESSLRLKPVSMTAAACLGLTALGIALYCVRFSSQDAGSMPLCAGGYLLSAGIMLAVNRIESRIHYLELPPKAVPPEKSTPIIYFSNL